MPKSICSLFLNIDWIYLLTSLVVCGVIGHMRVLNFWSSEKSLNPGILLLIFSNKLSRVTLNLQHSTMKCCSESMHSFVVVWQYAQMRRCSGVTGRVLRSSSVARVCALMRNRVRDDLWFLFLISFMYGSVVKDDLNCLYTRNLLWSRLSVFEALNSLILSNPNDNQSQTSSSLPWAWHSSVPAC